MTLDEFLDKLTDLQTKGYGSEKVECEWGHEYTSEPEEVEGSIIVQCDEPHDH